MAISADDRDRAQTLVPELGELSSLGFIRTSCAQLFHCEVEASQGTYVSKLAVRNFSVLQALRVLVQFAQRREYMYYDAGRTGDTAVTYCQP